MGLPYGFNPNVKLGKFLGRSIFYLIDCWCAITLTNPMLRNLITAAVTPFEPNILKSVSLFGLMGFSSLLAVSQDILLLITLHIYAIYFAFASLYQFLLCLIQTLLRLYRGIKYNVLSQVSLLFPNLSSAWIATTTVERSSSLAY